MQVILSFLKERKRLLVRIVALALPAVALLVSLGFTAFAQTTYVITDGDQVKVYTTYATDPAFVLDQAGFELGEDDTYTTQSSDGVSEITVQRSQRILVNNCGEKMEVTSYGESLQALLNRLGIPSYGEYTVSLPLNTKTCDGMEVSVDSVVQMEQTYTEDIPYEVIHCYDPTMPQGQQKMLTTGVIGHVRKTANVVYVNTVETSHTVIQEIVTQQPVNQIVVVGTGAQEDTESLMPAIGDGVIVTADGQILTYSESAHFVASAYTKTDEGCDEITATGTTVRTGTVAVDPTLVPYGTRMFIVTNDGQYIYGVGTAEDCGGAIKGNRLDLYFHTDAECVAFGIRDCTVYFLD